MADLRDHSILCSSQKFHEFSSLILILAEYLHICTKNDPNLPDCIKKSIENLRPYLVRGIPELEIPSIDPIDIGDLLVAENTRQNGIQITAKDIKSYGSSAFRIRNIE